MTNILSLAVMKTKLIKYLPIFLILGIGLVFIISTAPEKSQTEENSLISDSKLPKESSDSFTQNYDALTKVLSQFETKQVHVVAFWADWCVPCIKELKDLNKFLKAGGSELVSVLAINVDYEDQEKIIDKRIKELSPVYSVIPDEEGGLTKALGIETLPYSVIYVDSKPTNVFSKSVDFSSLAFWRVLFKENNIG